MKYEKWSLGYWCLKQYVRFIDWIIHNKKIIVGKENIPKDKPILFAPNHQNALSDPMAVLLNTTFQPVWLARADIFKKGIVSTLLRFLKIMPVYRMRDGKENLAKNEKTFSDSIKVLENNFALALFPEAAHTGKRQMISHKKAVPRIVFMAEEKAANNLDIHIVPTGIYYSHYWKFNRNLIVNFGEPVRVNDFLEEYKENSSAATISLQKKLFDAIEPLVVNIKSKKYYADFETVREIYGKYFLKRKKQKYSILNLFYSDQKLSTKLDELEQNKPGELENLIALVGKYQETIKKYKLKSWLLDEHINNFWKIVLNKLILILGLPIFIFGFVFNAIPFFFIDFLTAKKVKDEAFKSSFFLGLGMFVFPLVYLLELLAIVWVLPGIWLNILFVILLPITGKIAFKWYILFLKTVGRGRLFLLQVFRRKEFYELFKQKETLYKKLDALITP